MERAIRNGREGRAGLPRFRRKKVLEDNGARLAGSIRVTPRHARLPRIDKARTKERTDKPVAPLHERKARILSAAVSREADRRFVRLTGEVERPDPEPREIRGPEGVAGIDGGPESFAVLSDGARIEAPKPLSRKPKRTVVEVDPEAGEERKRTVFSRHYEKAALRLARLRRRARSIRRGFLRKITTGPAKAEPVRAVEDLNVWGLARSPYLSRSIRDGRPSNGAVLITAPRSFPSARMCSRCGRVAPALPLSRRAFRGWAALKGPAGSSPGSHACRGAPRIPLAAEQSARAGPRATDR